MTAPAPSPSRARRTQFRLQRFLHGAVEAVAADSPQAFGRHMHVDYGFGLVDRGAQQSASGRGPVQAVAGDVITVNPGEVHDGRPLGDGGRAWRMLYLAPTLVRQLAADIAPQRQGGDLAFHDPVVRHGGTARQVDALMRALHEGEDDVAGMAVEHALLRSLAALLQVRPPPGRGAPTALARARAAMDDDPAAPHALAALAAEAGMSRFGFLRAFQRTTGLTPHAYLVQQRLALARQLMRAGHAPGDAAAAAGFSDQSHLTRLFVRSFGFTPGSQMRAGADARP